MTGPVSPETRIGPLLDEHPALEEVLIGLSPEFRRLRNPILRRTVARVATVAQAAKIGGLAVPDLVRALRRALGQDEGGAGGVHEAPDVPAGPPPDWIGAARPVETLDADAILARGATQGNYREYLQGDHVRVKKYFYVLRPVLACKWVAAHGTMPPMEFAMLVDDQLPTDLRPVVQIS